MSKAKPSMLPRTTGASDKSLMAPMDWLRARTRTTPTRTALIFEEQRWSYHELDRAVDAYAGALSSWGVATGDRLAALMANRPEYVILVHAAARLGAILVPLNVRLTAPELTWQLAQAGCKRLVCDAERTEQATLAAAEEPNELSLISVDAFAGAANGLALTPFQPLHLPQVQAIVFTSGTTGRPRGAALTFANHFWSATASAYRLGLDPADHWLSCLPLYHVGGLAVIFRSCLYGTAVVLHRSFDVDAVNHSLDRHPITLISLVPTMVYRLLEARGDGSWPASLRHLLVGGAATPPDLVERCLRQHIPIALTYGLTEAASQVATMVGDEVGRKPGCVGKPLMFTSVRIVDELGRSLPPGAYGEVAISGPTVMAGYEGDAAATTRTLVGGELRSGDIGYLDDDGDLWLVQRRSDLIISGGENVYPAEVEAVLRQHPQVAAVCVVGVPSREWGQQVAAMVVPRSADLTDADLRQFGRRQLAGYKLPRRVKFVAALPLTASGKIHRRAVTQEMTAVGDETS